MTRQLQESNTVVPLTTLLSFICLALVPTLVFATQMPSLFPYPPYLPFPILEALTATALWSLSYLLRDFLYATALFIVPSSLSSSSTIIITILSATLQPPPSNRHPYFTYPILLFHQTSLFIVDRRRFQACMVGCPWLGSSGSRGRCETGL
jgi:hypothetical protein